MMRFWDPRLRIHVGAAQLKYDSLRPTLQKHLNHVKTWEPPEEERTPRNMGLHPWDSHIHVPCSSLRVSNLPTTQAAKLAKL